MTTEVLIRFIKYSECFGRKLHPNKPTLKMGLFRCSFSKIGRKSLSSSLQEAEGAAGKNPRRLIFMRFCRVK